MWASLKQTLKGWKTAIWSVFLIALGLGLTALSALDIVQLTAILPEKYKPFAPMLLAIIGGITGYLRSITTGPMGSKGNVSPEPVVKAGD